MLPQISISQRGWRRGSFAELASSTFQPVVYLCRKVSVGFIIVPATVWSFCWHHRSVDPPSLDEPVPMRPEHLPNIITASRIVLTPLFIYLMMSGDSAMVQASAAVFLVAAISDWYDGWYARKYNAMTSFGRFFDPLADKVLIGAAFFAFAFLDILSLWMVLVIVGRDVLVTVLRVVADRRNQPVVTSNLAKWKTALQLVFLWYVVLVFTLQNVAWLREYISAATIKGLLSPWVVTSSMLLLTLLSIITAVQYLIANRHVLRFINGKFIRTSS